MLKKTPSDSVNFVFSVSIFEANCYLMNLLREEQSNKLHCMNQTFQIFPGNLDDKPNSKNKSFWVIASIN